jgi:LmbE family N-acetylglucosaminyl deacetylase
MMLPKRGDAGTTLILLPHQDDEIALAPLLPPLISAGKTLRLVYLTDGGMRTAPARRNAESLRALAFLGLETTNVHFLGTEIGVRDGRLIFHLSTVFDHLQRTQSGSGTVDEIYALAWEGGHQDHDAAYVLAAAIASAGNGLKHAWQVPVAGCYRNTRAAAALVSKC